MTGIPAIIGIVIATGILTCATPNAEAAENGGKKNLFVPTSSWLVGPASPVSLADTDSKIPCVMINQYDNGFTFRISGGGGKVLAIALDTRQDAFKPGKSYRIDIEVPPYVDVALPGAAYNETTLIANTQEIEGFYKNLSEAETMKIGIGQSRMEFSLLGIGEGLSRLESCYGSPQNNEKGNATTKAASDIPVPGMRELPIPEETSITPMPGEFALPPADALPGEETVKAAQSLSRIEPASGNAQESRTAKIEKISSPQETVKTEQQLARSWSNPLTRRGQNPQTAKPHETMASATSPAMEKWQAEGGKSLRESLQSWAGRANVELIWNADQDYKIGQPLQLDGTFESAAAAILEQYADDPERPVGKIYNDPSAHRRVLLVETHKEDR